MVLRGAVSRPVSGIGARSQREGGEVEDDALDGDEEEGAEPKAVRKVGFTIFMT